MMDNEEMDEELLTVPELFMKRIAGDPRFVIARPGGKAIVISGARPTVDAVAQNDDAQPAPAKPQTGRK
jgi:hypothetical protein